MVQPMARPIYQPVRRMPMAVPMARPVYVPVFRPPMMPRLNIAPKQSYRNPSGQGMIFGDRLPGAGPVAPRRSFVPSVSPMVNAAPMMSTMASGAAMSPPMMSTMASRAAMSPPMYTHRRVKRANSEASDKRPETMGFLPSFFSPFMPNPFMPRRFIPRTKSPLSFFAKKQSYVDPATKSKIS